eukprot:719127-Karenia_brevis.AAC.2
MTIRCFGRSRKSSAGQQQMRKWNKRLWRPRNSVFRTHGATYAKTVETVGEVGKGFASLMAYAHIGAECQASADETTVTL